jgi:hypothetical protein
MAKDRNTFAKRQREMERKRKQDEKRQHKAKRKQDASNPSPHPVDSQEIEQHVGVATQTPSSLLSPAQRTVLTTFRQFRMTPGQMLCFSRSDEDTFRAPLTELAAGGYLVTERFQGGYSLTASGFAAMQSIA